jgi:hypothetical protein
VREGREGEGDAAVLLVVRGVERGVGACCYCCCYNCCFPIAFSLSHARTPKISVDLYMSAESDKYK